MRQRYKNTLMLAVAGVALLTLLLLPATVADQFRQHVTQFLGVVFLGTHISKAQVTPTSTLKSREELLAELKELRTEVDRVAPQLARLRELEKENERLKEMLSFKQSQSFKAIPARVIWRDPANWWRTVVIDRGADDGIMADMAVVTPQGIIGKTLTVAPKGSWVLLITDPGCKVDGYLQESREYGIVEGTGELSTHKPSAQMNFISQTTKVKINEKVLTSGLGGVFPRGLLLGWVEQISRTPDGFFQKAGLNLAVNMKDLNEVFVLSLN